MAIKFIPGFKGGLTSNLYDPLEKQTYQTAKDLDVFNDGQILKPQYSPLTEITLGSMSGVSNFWPKNHIQGSNGTHYFLGTATISAATNTILASISTVSAAPSFTNVYADTGDNNFCAIEEYKTALYFQRNHLLKKFDFSSTTTAGTLGDSAERFGPIRNHKGLGKLFFAHGSGSNYNKVGHWDNTTFTEGALVIDSDYTVIGLEELGAFVVVAIRHKSDTQPSKFLIWDGSATTVDDSIDISDTGLQGFKVIGNLIRFITVNNPPTPVAAQQVIRLYSVYPGGTPILERELYKPSGSTINPNAFDVIGNEFLFAIDTIGVYSVGSKEKDIKPFLTDKRIIPSGTNSSIHSVNDTGDNLFICWTDTTSGTVRKISATAITSSYVSTGVYETGRFRLHPYKRGKLSWLRIPHKTLPANCSYVVKVIHFATNENGNTPESVETFSGATGHTQNTQNTTYTLIKDGQLTFKWCDEIQIQIALSGVASTNAPEIIFPLIMEVEEEDIT